LINGLNSVDLRSNSQIWSATTNW